MFDKILTNPSTQLIENSSATTGSNRYQVMTFTMKNVTQGDGSPARIHVQRNIVGDLRSVLIVLNDDIEHKQARATFSSDVDVIEEIKHYLNGNGGDRWEVVGMPGTPTDYSDNFDKMSEIP